eukprot:758071-Hanusia_phi.AAC.2
MMTVSMYSSRMNCFFRTQFPVMTHTWLSSSSETGHFPISQTCTAPQSTHPAISRSNDCQLHRCPTRPCGRLKGLAIRNHVWIFLSPHRPHSPFLVTAICEWYCLPHDVQRRGSFIAWPLIPPPKPPSVPSK